MQTIRGSIAVYLVCEGAFGLLINSTTLELSTFFFSLFFFSRFKHNLLNSIPISLFLFYFIASPFPHIIFSHVSHHPVFQHLQLIPAQIYILAGIENDYRDRINTLKISAYAYNPGVAGIPLLLVNCANNVCFHSMSQFHPIWLPHVRIERTRASHQAEFAAKRLADWSDHVDLLDWGSNLILFCKRD